VVWVWSTNAGATSVAVQTSVASAAGIRTPSYVVCPHTSGTTCKLGDLAVGQMDELQVAVRVGPHAALGGLVQLTSKATGHKADSFTGSASDLIVAAPTSTPSSSVTLPAPGKLPAISGTGVSPTDPSGLFPTVSSTPSAGSSNLGLPSARSHGAVRATEDAATVPLDSKLIGGQLAGLAVLAGAVTIAIARLSLRTRQPQPQTGDTRLPSRRASPSRPSKS
jgi:hypothetical protein